MCYVSPIIGEWWGTVPLTFNYNTEHVCVEQQRMVLLMYFPAIQSIKDPRASSAQINK